MKIRCLPAFHLSVALISTAALLSLAPITTSALDIYSLLDSQPHADITVQPCNLTNVQLQELLSSFQEALPTDHGGPTGDKYVLINSKLSARFVQSSAQLLAPIGVKVCTFNNPTASGGEAFPLQDDINIFLPSVSHRLAYYGKHDADTLHRYVQKLDIRFSSSTSAPFQTITNKFEKKSFDFVQTAKVVAFFPDSSVPDFAQFQQAARQLTPNPSFYVVHDAKFASKFHLSTAGQIVLIHRLEKSFVHFRPEIVQPTATSQQQQADVAVASFSAADIIAWIKQNQFPIIYEVDETNLYDPHLIDSSKYQLLAIADKQSPLGYYFFKILTKAIQNITKQNELHAKLATKASTQQMNEADAQFKVVENETATTEQEQELPLTAEPIRLDDIRIVWIDLQKYPLAAQKLQQSDAFIAANSALPHNTFTTFSAATRDIFIGLVHTPNNVLTANGESATTAQWFDTTQLQALQTPKISEQANIELIKNWLLSVTDRLPTPKTFSADPALDHQLKSEL